MLDHNKYIATCLILSNLNIIIHLSMAALMSYDLKLYLKNLDKLN